MFNFWKHKREHPKIPYIYAVTTGAYVGELLVYMEDKTEEHVFLSIPKMIVRNVPKDKFKLGIENKIVDVVERLPKIPFKVCQAQYQKNKIK